MSTSNWFSIPATAFASCARSCWATIMNLVIRMKTSSTVKYFTNQPMSKKGIRLGILMLAGGAGVWLLKCGGEPLLNFLGIAEVDITKSGVAKPNDNASIYPTNARGYLVLPMLSFFVFIALWFFRTYDTRQQIQQANFVKGLENLVSDNPLQIDIGVILLLEVSKATSVFDKEIRLAFIKRLKELPGDLNGRKVMDMRTKRLSYAQYIIQWLINNPKSGDPLDLSGMDCRYQEFTSRGDSGRTNKKLEIAKILTSQSGKSDDVNSVPGVTFEEAFCENISFKGVNVSKYNFTNAEKFDIRGAYINPFIVLGLDLNKVSRKHLDQTGAIGENPDWPNPESLPDKCIRIWQKCKTNSPK